MEQFLGFFPQVEKDAVFFRYNQNQAKNCKTREKEVKREKQQKAKFKPGMGCTAPIGWSKYTPVTLNLSSL